MLFFFLCDWFFLLFGLIILLLNEFIPDLINIQRRNLRIVYDAIATLADAVGGKLNQVT